MTSITSVSDTAFLVAAYRALEARRPDAVVRDAFAERLAGERGMQLAREFGGGAAGGRLMGVRTRWLDDAILAAVAGGVDTVLDLAAGLDARAFRLDLPASLRWVDVDLPHVQAYKREVLAAEEPRCDLVWDAVDLADAGARRSLFERHAGGGRRVLAVTEGLLMYLRPADVDALARDLRAAEVETWLTDLFGNRWVRLLWAWRGRRAPLRFMPSRGPAFFAGAGWRAVRHQSLIEAAIALHAADHGATWLDRLVRSAPVRSTLLKTYSLVELARC